MNLLNSPKSVALAALFVLIYTVISATGDAAAKHIAQEYSAPQLFALSGGFVALFSFGFGTRSKGLVGLRTEYKGAMAIRSVATVVSAILFFMAYHELALAEVFIFIGIMPLLTALMTPLILKESADRGSWFLLVIGFFGVVCLFPEGIPSITVSHMLAFAATLFGVTSMVMARYIGRHEDNSMALLFYPNFLMFVVMGIALPFVYKSMPLTDFLVAALYSTLLFVGRFFLVKALSLQPAHVVLPVLNFQFIWMVLLGMVFFSETPGLNVYLGASFVILSCVKCVLDSAKRDDTDPKQLTRIEAPRSGRSKWPRSRSSSHSRMNLMRSGYRSQIAPRSVPR